MLNSNEAPLCQSYNCMCDCVSVSQNGRVNSLKLPSHSKQRHKSFGFNTNGTPVSAYSICDMCAIQDHEQQLQQQKIRDSAKIKQSRKYAKEVVAEIGAVLESQFSEVIQSLMRSIEESERRVEEADKLKQVKEEWGDVAKVADHFLFYFFPSLTVLTCLVIFFNSPHALSWLD